MALVERRGRSTAELMEQCIAPVRSEFWGRPSLLAPVQDAAAEAAQKPKVSRRQKKRVRVLLIAILPLFAVSSGLADQLLAHLWSSSEELLDPCKPELQATFDAKMLSR